jgi:hypothetical protein
MRNTSIIHIHIRFIHLLTLIITIVIVIIIAIIIVTIGLLSCIELSICTAVRTIRIVWIDWGISCWRELLLLHLAKLKIVEIVLKSHVGDWHILRCPISLKNRRHCIDRNNGENYLCYYKFTMGIETPTLLEQQSQLIS